MLEAHALAVSDITGECGCKKRNTSAREGLLLVGDSGAGTIASVYQLVHYQGG